MTDDDQFFIAVNHQQADQYVIKVNGAVHQGNAARLHDALLDGLLGSPAILIVDLAAVDTIDSSGLDVLVCAHRTTMAAGTRLLFRRPCGQVGHLLERNGLAIPVR